MSASSTSKSPPSNAISMASRARRRTSNAQGLLFQDVQSDSLLEDYFHGTSTASAFHISGMASFYKPDMVKNMLAFSRPAEVVQKSKKLQHVTFLNPADAAGAFLYLGSLSFSKPVNIYLDRTSKNVSDGELALQKDTRARFRRAARPLVMYSVATGIPVITEQDGTISKVLTIAWCLVATSSCIASVVLSLLEALELQNEEPTAFLPAIMIVLFNLIFLMLRMVALFGAMESQSVKESKGVAAVYQSFFSVENETYISSMFLKGTRYVACAGSVFFVMNAVFRWMQPDLKLPRSNLNIAVMLVGDFFQCMIAGQISIVFTMSSQAIRGMMTDYQYDCLAGLRSDEACVHRFFHIMMRIRLIVRHQRMYRGLILVFGGMVYLASNAVIVSGTGPLPIRLMGLMLMYAAFTVINFYPMAKLNTLINVTSANLLAYNLLSFEANPEEETLFSPAGMPRKQTVIKRRQTRLRTSRDEAGSVAVGFLGGAPKRVSTTWTNFLRYLTSRHCLPPLFKVLGTEVTTPLLSRGTYLLAYIFALSLFYRVVRLGN